MLGLFYLGLTQLLQSVYVVSAIWRDNNLEHG